LSDQKGNLGATEWLTAGGVGISDESVMIELKLGSNAGLLEKLALRKIAVAMASKLEIADSDQELDEAVAAFYAERKLFDSQQIFEWRHSLRLAAAALREYVRETLHVRKLREKLVSDESVRERFGMNPHQYARVDAEVFVFSSDGAAREFVLAVRENETEPIHGARRRITRRYASQEAGALIFSAEPGDLVGPVEIDYQCFEVYRLLRRERPVLDSRLERQIRDELFDELLRVELTRDPIKFLA
jgi:parvulin-like peptidyl-prolyl isomerase